MGIPALIGVAVSTPPTPPPGCTINGQHGGTYGDCCQGYWRQMLAGGPDGTYEFKRRMSGNWLDIYETLEEYSAQWCSPMKY